MTKPNYDNDALHEIDDWAKAIGEQADDLVKQLKAGEIDRAGQCQHQITQLAGEMQEFLGQLQGTGAEAGIDGYR